MFDVLIKGGRIVDGSGNPWYHGSVGIKGDRLKILKGDVSSVRAARVIDASGCVVSPGFIDTHAHSDLSVLSNPLLEPKIMQGITTELVGLCGVGYSPASKSNLEVIKLYPSFAETLTARGIEWSSVSEYLRCLHYHRASINVAVLIPNGNARLEVLGWNERSATKDEIKKMQSIVRKGLEEGAVGLSSGLSFPPSIWADTNELVELCKVVAEFGGVYATHVRYEKGHYKFDGFKEAVEIGKRSGVAVNISHLFCNLETRGQPDKLLQIIDEGRKVGVDVTFDAYPYFYGTSPLTDPLIAIWAHDGGPQEMLKRLKSPAERAKMWEDVSTIWGDNWADWNRRHYIAGVHSEKNKWCEGLTLQEIANKVGKSVMDAACELLIEEKLQVVWNNSREYPGAEEDIKTIMTHPACLVCSDAIMFGNMPNPRVYGAFPKVLRWLVREEKALTLEDAINKMTFLPARRYGLSDRGILQDGRKADIVIFDPDSVADRSTVTEPKQYPVGIEYVFVNGKLTVEKGRHLGVLNGEPLTMNAS